MQPDDLSASPTRRDLLRQAAGVAASLGTVAAAEPPAKTDALLPTIKLGGAVHVSH